ncbi:MAG: phosphotransacetylase family protein [Candidatus Thorarchaeota archaeon]
MTKNIVISGETLSGKTMVALAIAAKLQKKGHKVGYFKPVGFKSFEHSKESLDVDEDAAVMKEVLDLDAEISCICPIVRTKSSYDELIRVGREALVERIKECYTKVAKGKDFVVIEGARAPWHLLHVELSTPQIAKMLDASVICLVNFPEITSIDEVLLQRDLFMQHGIEEIGLILNMVPPMLKTTVEKHIRPFFEDSGLKFLGVVYQKRELFSPTVRDILKALNGEMIIGEDQMDILVDRFMVGSMAPENALKWFRRAKDKAVITSGDRTDICLAALETDTNLLILAGGMGPDIRTLSRARELGVPIMMTAHDTFTTSQKVDDLVGTVTPENKKRVATVQNIIGKAIDLTSFDP